MDWWLRGIIAGCLIALLWHGLLAKLGQAPPTVRAAVRRFWFHAGLSNRPLGSHPAISADNAVMEHFFLNLKMERVWQRDYANHQEAIRDVTDYIVGFYNSQRLHSTLGYLSPNGYERQMTEKQSILVSEKT